MKSSIKASVLAVALLGGSAWAGLDWFGAMAAGFEGQNLQQCMSTCRPGDGQCYQGCSAAYGPQSRPPQQRIYQQPQQFQNTDLMCMGRCQSANNPYGLCEKHCSY